MRSKDVKQIIKRAEKQGWYLERNNKHMVFKHPDAERGTVTVSNSTTDRYALLKIRRNFGL